MENINISSATYYEKDGINISINIVVDGETLSVPLDPANRHYAAILEWVAEGNTIEDAD
jgi:hypothetical protein